MHRGTETTSIGQERGRERRRIEAAIFGCVQCPARVGADAGPVVFEVLAPGKEGAPAPGTGAAPGAEAPGAPAATGTSPGAPPPPPPGAPTGSASSSAASSTASPVQKILCRAVRTGAVAEQPFFGSVTVRTDHPRKPAVTFRYSGFFLPKKK